MSRWTAKVKKVQPDDFRDPYLTALEYKDKSVCRVCQNIYHGKRWVIDENLYGSLMKKPESVVLTVCPSCRKIESHYFEGVVKLSGDFLFEHKDEILNLIKNTEIRSDYINPQSKIEDVEINEIDKTITLKTTSEELARRIGKNVNNAYNGNLKISFSRDDRLVRVYWTR